MGNGMSETFEKSWPYAGMFILAALMAWRMYAAIRLSDGLRSADERLARERGRKLQLVVAVWMTFSWPIGWLLGLECLDRWIDRRAAPWLSTAALLAVGVAGTVTYVMTRRGSERTIALEALTAGMSPRMPPVMLLLLATLLIAMLASHGYSRL
jgi:hypothetical protein